jgi:Glyoxalase-like domain
MAVGFQLVIDCADPRPLARLWAAALGSELEPPPAGFATGMPTGQMPGARG